ncbi:MAG TPA: hypothetical protein PLY72_06885 [Candidatus Obscuribacter sp.]|nr:hypothetical protein [Candidatus Obscuribacter sp.]
MNPLPTVSDIFSPNFLSWCVTFACALLALDTVLRLWTERHRLTKEVLSDDDRAFAWKIVLFLVLPLLTLADLRATEVAASHFGAYLARPVYGLVWYQGDLSGLSSIHDMPSLFLVIFAGAITQILFALCLLPALAVRPHPFLATLLGYTIAFPLALNLVFEPLLSLSGMASLGAAPRMETLVRAGVQAHYWTPLFIQMGASLLYLLCILSPPVRQWFASLTRPQVSQELAECLRQWRGQKEDQELSCQVGLLYVKTGLLFKARNVLQSMKKQYPGSPYTDLLAGVLAFHRQKYQEARQAFEKVTNHPAVEGELRAQLLAAAACAAFAQQDLTAALNFADRALEFEDGCLTARMVKVDVYLAQGKKEQAAQEIFVAMHLGLEFDLKDKIPIDSEKALIYLRTAIESHSGEARFTTASSTKELVERPSEVLEAAGGTPAVEQNKDKQA